MYRPGVPKRTEPVVFDRSNPLRQGFVGAPTRMIRRRGVLSNKGMSAATSMPQLLDDLSLEITGNQAADLASAAAMLPLARGSTSPIWPASNSRHACVPPAPLLRSVLCRFPHVAARRLVSQADVERFLSELQEVGASSSVFAVAGDPRKPQGPYDDSLALIDSGLLERYGAEDVAIAGYPEGHPDIQEQVLWEALERKHSRLAELGIAGDIVTQFGF